MLMLLKMDVKIIFYFFPLIFWEYSHSQVYKYQYCSAFKFNKVKIILIFFIFMLQIFDLLIGYLTTFELNRHIFGCILRKHIEHTASLRDLMEKSKESGRIFWRIVIRKSGSSLCTTCRCRKFICANNSMWTKAGNLNEMLAKHVLTVSLYGTRGL